MITIQKQIRAIRTSFTRCLTRFTTTHYLILLLIFLSAPGLKAAPGIVRASNIESLSNNSLLMLEQDERGFMWLGSYDGLNRYDGKGIRVFRHETDNPLSLSGNVINEVHKAEREHLWVLTTMGLDKFSTRHLTADEHYDEIRAARHSFISDTLGNAFAVSPDCRFMYYDKVEKKFRTVKTPDFVGSLSYCPAVMTGNNTVWYLPRDHYAYKLHFDFSAGYDEKHARFQWQKVKIGEYRTFEVFESPRGFYTLNSVGEIHHHDIMSHTVRLIRDLRQEVDTYGKVTKIVPLGNDIYVSFANAGVMRLDGNNDYAPEMIYTETGAFNMIHDKRQNLIWVATDGRGLYKICDTDTRYKSIHSSQIPGLTKPIRTFFTDSRNNLWIGTKGNGLIVLKDYTNLPTEGEIPPDRIVRMGTHPGAPGDLPTNQIFSIKESAFTPGRIWIAGKGPGISHIDAEHRLVNLDGQNIGDIHDLFEASDSVLWLASSTVGLIKVVTDGGNRVLHTDTFIFRVGQHTCYEIYTMAWDGHDTLYIGCRGGIGIIRFNLNDCTYSPLRNINEKIPGIGDIISLAYTSDGTLYFGSSIGGGIVDCSDPENPRLTKVLTSSDGMANDMVHSIIPDIASGNVWLSTNKGLARYNTATGVLHNTTGIAGDINEFCDNSGYISPQSGNLIFGALNGIVCVKKDAAALLPAPDSGLPAPEVVLTGLTVNGVDMLPDYGRLEGNLEFNYNDDVISISFAALDYITGDYINYWYQLEGVSDKWINLGTSPTVTLSNLPPGSYTLRVRCENDGENAGLNTFVLPFKVNPAWYDTWYSYTICLLLIAGIIYFVYSRSRRIYAEKRRELELRLHEQEQERLYADRKEFFTNITHEFCSPLTMIMGMCDEIKKQTDKPENQELRSCVDSLCENSKYLNELVQEILDVRYMEEGTFIHLKIQPIAIENVFKRWVHGYEEIAHQNGITFITEIEQPDMRWNTDVSCLSKIVTNLMSNAVKYTPTGGEIRVSARQTPDGSLQLEVRNTGQGIPPEQLQQLFNKFAIFNNVDTNGYREMSSRHGLGLFITHGMVAKLGGTIEADSVEGEYTRFTVTLPPMSVQAGIVEDSAAGAGQSEASDQPIDVRPEVLVVDDNPDILWLVSKILSDDYNVTSVRSVAEARKQTERQIPAVIITDIMMSVSEENGLDFIRYIRSNKFTRHLPVIVLTAKISEEDKIEGYKAGADAYVTKPFNSDVLKSLVANMIARKDADKDYYRSSESAITLQSGLEISNEGKQFIDTIRKYISENLEDENKLSPVELAKAAGVDVRTLYRRFKKYSPYTPSEFVKKCRYAYGARLILTTDLTIQEIIYRIGMNNKTVFYADFKKIYGMTPKEYRSSHQKVPE